MDKHIQSDRHLSLEYTQRTLKKYYPYRLILIFSLFGVSTLFIGLTLAYLFSKSSGDEWTDVSLPLAFYFSTPILLASSATIGLARKAFEHDGPVLYRYSLAVTFGLSLIFIFFQLLGWNELRDRGIYLNNSTSGSYIILITLLHGAHLLAGLIFLSIFSFNAWRKVSHPAMALVYFSDPVKRMRLEMVAIYWHYIDAVWIYLFLFFLVNYFWPF